MTEFRYTRRKLPSHKSHRYIVDSYNALLHSPQGPPLEYWTNGTTTLIMSTTTKTTSASEATPPPQLSEGTRRRLSVPISSSRQVYSHSDSDHSSSIAPLAGRQRSHRHNSSNSSRSDNSNNHDLLVRHSLIAGSISGMASTFALYPLDLLRTKLQTSGLAQVTSTAAATTTTASPSSTAMSSSVVTSSSQSSKLMMGPYQLFKHTIQHGGGIRALYTGMAMPVAAQALYKGTVFTVNNVTQKFLLEYRTLENHKLGQLQAGQLTWLDRFWCGCIGGAVNAFFFVTPVEFVRNQLIAQQNLATSTTTPSTSSIWRQTQNLTQTDSKSRPHTSWGVIRSSIQHHGVSSLWRGASWSVARDGWGCGWFFVTMHYAPHFLNAVLSGDLHSNSTATNSFPITVAAGGLAGLAYWVASLPLDTIKTWIQSADLNGQRVSATGSIQTILNQQGPIGVVRQLFRGWQVAYGRGIPSAAITISVYSMVYDRLHKSATVRAL